MHQPYEVKKLNEIEKKPISVKFKSTDQEIIDYEITGYNTYIFLKFKEELLSKFPYLNEKEIYFIANGLVINEQVSLFENKIEDGTIILITIND